jgi:hypothetical protein
MVGARVPVNVNIELAKVSAQYYVNFVQSWTPSDTHRAIKDWLPADLDVA